MKKTVLYVNKKIKNRRVNSRNRHGNYSEGTRSFLSKAFNSPDNNRDEFLNRFQLWISGEYYTSRYNEEYEIKKVCLNFSRNTREISHFKISDDQAILTYEELAQNLNFEKAILAIIKKEDDPGYWENCIKPILSLSNPLATGTMYYNQETIKSYLEDYFENADTFLLVIDKREFFLDLENKTISKIGKEIIKLYGGLDNVAVTNGYLQFPRYDFKSLKNPFIATKAGIVEETHYSVSQSEVADLIHFNPESEILNGKDTYYMFRYKGLLRGALTSKRQIYLKEAYKTDYKLFLCKTENAMQIFTGSNFENFTYISYGTFMNYSDLEKYNKAKITIHDFLVQSGEYEGLSITDPEEIKRRIQEIFGEHVQYTDQIREMFTDPCPSPISKHSAFKKNITGNLNFSGIAELSLHKANSDYDRILRCLEENEQKLNQISSEIRYAEETKRTKLNNLQSKKQDIERYKDYIDSLQKQVATLSEEIEILPAQVEKNRANLLKYQNLKQTLEPQAQRMKDEHLEKLELKYQQIATNQEDLWLKNLNKQSINVVDIVYRDTRAGKTISVNEDSGIPLLAKYAEIKNDKKYVLSKIVFNITKPVIIKVDYADAGEACKKVVAGPFNVVLQQSDIDISPLTSNAVFGLDKERKCVWFHPHTSSINYNGWTFKVFVENITERSARGCLGEASQAIYKAFQENDPRMAILAAMTWITSANSSDAWGKNWKYFPRLEEVKTLESDYSYEKVKKEDELKALSNSESIFDFFSSDLIQSNAQTFQDYISSQNAESQEESEEPEEHSNVELRRIENPGYTSFTSTLRQ